MYTCMYVCIYEYVCICVYIYIYIAHMASDMRSLPKLSRSKDISCMSIWSASMKDAWLTLDLACNTPDKSVTSGHQLVQRSLTIS